MVQIRFPDNNVKEFNRGVSAAEIATSISPSLAKKAIAAKIDDQLVDLSFTINKDANIAIVTATEADALNVIRHSTAHLLAQAVKTLFPSAQVTIGPVIENGFYYDFAYERGFTQEDLSKIEDQMQALVKANLPLTRKEVSRDEAIKLFTDLGEKYKVEIVSEIPANETLSLYQQGEFVDLCRGPHVPSTGKLGVFKLMKVAGAYWRGDHRNAMLQRIYGTAFADKKSLENYLFQLEEAEKRDHRKQASKLDLFHFQEEAPGMVFWHPNGWSIYLVIREYIRNKQRQAGYQEVNTPQIVDEQLWHDSGHMEKFNDDIFMTPSEHKNYVIKPMNCPCHIQIFKHGLKSYKDFPIRLSEFGSCHRNEPSGALHGLMRVRNFVQDDGHIFCLEDQIAGEVSAFTEQLYEIYKDFGFTDIQVKLSTRPEKRVGSDEIWDKAEKMLMKSLDDQGLAWELQPAEGAFYGPKIEYSLKDCLGRVWQCGTIQVDFFLPERLGAVYIADDSSKKHPVMLHRATLGSFERFIGILLEQFAGNLPVWLAPIQVVVMNISESQAHYTQKIHDELHKQGIRTKIDLRNEKIGYKIREHTMARVPYQIIIGDKECEAGTIAVRTLDGKQQFGISLDTFFTDMTLAIKQLGRQSLSEQ
ncbi:MAG: threonine--tRNA ligase [Gammaproteobacteria bacterium RIFCSPHIGHO2_12_FULL_41_15]|nr:MAG: threonine--tRNA ligase [Gammaproteobacteria bacterium RIFCSPHIGHO2_12_FULL_41_15]